MENVRGKMKRFSLISSFLSPIPPLKTILMIFAFLGQILTGSAQVRVHKNINYAGNSYQTNTLNIYQHKGNIQNQDVIIFVHGGSWSSGKKETYWWLGRNFAKKNIVAVIINYPLAPSVTYKEMAAATAQAVKWVRDSIAGYGGNPNRIFIMGHSAGGHLAELVNADPQYFKTAGINNPIKGVILNDPFGLDMNEYLTEAEKDHYYTDFLRTFSSDAKIWQAGSPLTYIKNVTNPHLLFYGTKTYQAIQIQTERMFKTLTAQKIPVQLIKIKGKKHIPMISQMIWSNNKLYSKIFAFMAQTK